MVTCYNCLPVTIHYGPLPLGNSVCVGGGGGGAEGVNRGRAPMKKCIDVCGMGPKTSRF